VTLVINSDDQIYTKTYADSVHKFKEGYYTVVLSPSEHFETTVKECCVPYLRVYC